MNAPPVCCGIEDPARQHLAVLGERDHDAERRFSAGVIVGAVDRIDDPHPALIDAVKQRRVRRHRFFADDPRRCVDRDEAGGERFLAQPVGDRHHVVRGLFLHLVGGKVAEAWQDDLGRDTPHQLDDGVMVRVVHVSSCNRR
jgi:hypothetical protein